MYETGAPSSDRVHLGCPAVCTKIKISKYLVNIREMKFAARFRLRAINRPVLDQRARNFASIAKEAGLAEPESLLTVPVIPPRSDLRLSDRR